MSLFFPANFFVGHTTNCFCRVHGIDSAEPYLTTNGGSDQKPIEGVKQLAHALFPVVSNLPPVKFPRAHVLSSALLKARVWPPSSPRPLCAGPNTPNAWYDVLGVFRIPLP